MRGSEPGKLFYGRWIVVAAFLNFFFVVGIIFYGFPVFYTSFVESLGFTRAQVTQGFFLGFLIVGLPFGMVAGAIIDRIGAKWVIVTGAAFIGASLLLMARMTKLWSTRRCASWKSWGTCLRGRLQRRCWWRDGFARGAGVRWNRVLRTGVRRC